jgi:hypothetical protein
MSEPLTRRQVAGTLLASHLAAFGTGYVLAPKEPVDKEAKHTGFFRIDTSRVLATTVESLREENKLLVYSYKGSATVRADRSVWLVFGGHQELTVPAVVNFYLDLSGLSSSTVTYDEASKLVRVRLQPLTVGDIAFQPENATSINGGLLTWDNDQVEALRKLNYKAARRAMIAQAQQAGLLRAARRQAVDNIEKYFTIPLHVAGQEEVKVIATFD